MPSSILDTALPAPTIKPAGRHPTPSAANPATHPAAPPSAAPAPACLATPAPRHPPSLLCPARHQPFSLTKGELATASAAFACENVPILQVATRIPPSNSRVYLIRNLLDRCNWYMRDNIAESFLIQWFEYDYPYMGPFLNRLAWSPPSSPEPLRHLRLSQREHEPVGPVEKGGGIYRVHHRVVAEPRGTQPGHLSLPKARWSHR